jgi:hypothetical protein
MFPKQIGFEVIVFNEIEEEILVIDANRGFSSKRDDLISSLQLYPQVQPIIITPYKGKYAVIDGNHRWITSAILGLVPKAVLHTFERELNLPEIVVLIIASNGNNKPWNVKNYISCFASVGSPDYLRFEEYHKLYPNITDLESLYKMGNGVMYGTWNKTVKSGPVVFKFNPKDEHTSFFKGADSIVKAVVEARENYSKRQKKSVALEPMTLCPKNVYCMHAFKFLYLGYPYANVLRVLVEHAHELTRGIYSDMNEEKLIGFLKELSK